MDMIGKEEKAHRYVEESKQELLGVGRSEQVKQGWQTESQGQESGIANLKVLRKLSDFPKVVKDAPKRCNLVFVEASFDRKDPSQHILVPIADKPWVPYHGQS